MKEREYLVSRCPPRELLDRIGQDSLDCADFAELEAHIEGCDACQQALEHQVDCGSSSEVGVLDPVVSAYCLPSLPGFVIERELGRGGMGVVYRAWQTQLERHVAIKVLSPSDGSGAEERKRWLREAQANVRVRHPNVVQLHEVGDQNGWLYLVLDLIPGGSLASRARGPLPARAAAELMVTVARAVEQIHRAGILHLDIKPSNILLDGPPDAPWDQLSPMITDFGISRTVDESGRTASRTFGARGTPSFMAPEQVGGSRAAIGPHSDIFALGSTLYSLLTGRPPFQAASAIETLDQVRAVEPASPSTLIPGLARDLETIVMKCLRKEPERRYESAEALADDLRRWLDGYSIRARPVTHRERASRWCRRRPATASLLAVLGLTIASSLVGFVVLWQRAEAQRSRAEAALIRAVDNETAASAAVHELVDLLATTVDSSHEPANKRVALSANRMRELIAQLRRNRDLGDSSLVAIGKLVQQVASISQRLGKFSEARGFIQDALDLFESRQVRGASSSRFDVQYCEILLFLAVIPLEQKEVAEAQTHLDRVERMLADINSDADRFGILIGLDALRKEVARLLAERGAFDARRHLYLSHIKLLDKWAARPGADPQLKIVADLARADFAADPVAIERHLRTAIETGSEDRRLPRIFEERIASWIVADVDLSGKGSTLPLETRADEVIKALDLRSARLRAYPAMRIMVARQLTANAAFQGMLARREARLEDARRIAQCFLVVATRMERENPEEVEFHIMLSHAHEQVAKNAWKVPNYQDIGEALRQALAEARVASGINPDHPVARVRAAALQDKLVNLIAEHPSATSTSEIVDRSDAN